MISLVMVWLSLATCMGLCRLRSRSPKPWVWIPDVLLPVVVLGMCHLYGYWRIRTTVETRPEQRFLVAAIQPAFPQTLIWESGEGAEKMTVLETLTEAALQTTPISSCGQKVLTQAIRVWNRPLSCLKSMVPGCVSTQRMSTFCRKFRPAQPITTRPFLSARMANWRGDTESATW